MNGKRKTGCGCLIVIVVVFLLFALIGSISGDKDTDSSDTGSATATTGENTGTVTETDKESDHVTYSTEFNPEYTTTCTDTSITIDMTYNCPDGALMQVVVMNSDLSESYSGTQPIKDGKVSFHFDLTNTDTKIYSALLSFQFNADTVVQPDNVKEVYGEYGDNLTGDNASDAVVDGHEGAKNGSITFTINYPSDDAVQQLRDSSWTEYVNNIVASSDGLITSIDQPSECVFYAYFTNNWYLLSDEEKEYLANTLLDGVQGAAKSIYGYDTISLSIYVGDSRVAESSLWSGGMKMK